MTNFFLDLYSMAHAFYRTRHAGSEKQLPAALCMVTAFLFLLNGLNIVELITGTRIPLPLDNRIRVIVLGLACFGLGLMAVKWFIRKHPLLQSSDQMNEHSQQMPRARKVALLSVVIGNFVLLIALSAFLRN